MSIGGSKNKTSSSSQQYVDPAQQQYLDALRGQGQQFFQGAIPGAVNLGGQLAGNLGGQGQQFLGGLGDIASGANPAAQNLQQLGSQANPFLNQQIAGLGGDIMRQLQGSLQQVGQGFGLSGQYGSSRQGLAEGQAITGALNEFGQQAANLRGGDLARQAQANQALLGSQLAAGQAGLGNLSGLYNLGLAPIMSGAGLFGQYADVIGPPTLITETISKGKGGSANIGFFS